MLDALLAAVLLVAGAALLTAGAEAFVDHVAGAATHLGVSVLALGVLLAGAEPEEAVTAMLAAGQGHPALAAGDAVGANLVIVTLTLGLAAVITRPPVGRRVAQYAAAAAVAGLLAVLLMGNGVLSRVEGTLLVATYVGGVAWVWRREQSPPVIGELAEASRDGSVVGVSGGHSGARAAVAEDTATSRELLWVFAGLLGMVTGGLLAVKGAERLVGAFGLTESVIGLTLLALATSAEMLALVGAAGRRGLTEVAVAGLIGAVAYNATVSLGLAAWVDPLLLGRNSPIVVVGSITALLPLVVLLGRRTGVLGRPVGAGLLLTYAAVVAWLFSR